MPENKRQRQKLLYIRPGSSFDHGAITLRGVPFGVAAIFSSFRLANLHWLQVPLHFYVSFYSKLTKTHATNRTFKIKLLVCLFPKLAINLFRLSDWNWGSVLSFSNLHIHTSSNLLPHSFSSLLSQFSYLVLISLVSLTHGIRVHWNTNEGPIVPPTSTVPPVPKPPFRDPAPVWEIQSNDIENPNPFVCV